MCVVGQVFGSRRYTAYCKGAPEKVIDNCLKETSKREKLSMIFTVLLFTRVVLSCVCVCVCLVPTNILSVLEEFGSSGYRVLALAYKDLPRKINWKSLYHLKLENVKILY